MVPEIVVYVLSGKIHRTPVDYTDNCTGRKHDEHRYEAKDKKNLENPGAVDLFNKYTGGKSGIPFFLIYNKKGVLIADSNIRKEGEGFDKPGSNMGCPAAPEEVAAFVEVLKKTSKINDSEIKAVSERFSKNRN